VVNTQTYENNSSAYSAFLSALQTTGFMVVDSNFKYKSPAGLCPFGTTYTYTFTNGDDDILNAWTTTCGTGTGNWRGIAGSVNALFEAQIPNFSSFISGTSL
jgi:hypothetical protein